MPSRQVFNRALKGTIFTFLFPLSLSLQAQQPNPEGQSASCDKQGVAIKFVSLKRTGPGKLSMVLELDNSSNVSYRFSSTSGGKSTLLIDDQGDTWKLGGMGGIVYNDKISLPGVKIKLTYPFVREQGGAEAKAANASVALAFYPATSAGSNGTCAFELRDMPIA